MRLGGNGGGQNRSRLPAPTAAIVGRVPVVADVPVRQGGGGTHWSAPTAAIVGRAARSGGRPCPPGRRGDTLVRVPTAAIVGRVPVVADVPVRQGGGGAQRSAPTAGKGGPGPRGAGGALPPRGGEGGRSWRGGGGGGTERPPLRAVMGGRGPVGADVPVRQGGGGTQRSAP